MVQKMIEVSVSRFQSDEELFLKLSTEFTVFVALFIFIHHFIKFSIFNFFKTSA